MNASPCKLSLEEWGDRYQVLLRSGFRPASYGGPLLDHVTRDGDLRLRHLHLDNSAAALRLWNFLLSENDRLREARAQGERIVGTMKDLGTVPVLAYSLPKVRAFYPDGSWWTPCLMECSDGLLGQAEALGLDASFCPVRAMVPAFLNGEHFPVPDFLICSTGAVCDDHCGREGAIIREVVEAGLRLPTIELEVPPVCDAFLPTLSSRLQALIEVARAR